MSEFLNRQIVWTRDWLLVLLGLLIVCSVPYLYVLIFSLYETISTLLGFVRFEKHFG